MGEARADATKALNNRGSALRAGDDDDVADAQHTEENELLRSAQDMIKRLTKERSQKEDEIIRHQTMLRDHREQAIRERVALETEILKLTDKLYQAKTDDVEKLRTAMGQLERGEVMTQLHYNETTGTHNWMKEAKDWEDNLAEKESTIDVLKKQVRQVRDL